VFTKLYAMEHDILSFDVDVEKVKELIIVFAQSYKLSYEHIEKLLVHSNTIIT